MYNRLVCHTLDELDKFPQKYVLVGTDKPIDIKKNATCLPNLNIEAFAGSRLLLVKRVLSLVLRHRIDLLLIGHVNYSPLGLLLRTFQPRMRYGVFMYGIDVWKKLPSIHARALKEADFLVSISEYTKQQAVEVNGIPARLTYLLPNALEWTENIASEDIYESQHKGPVLLSVCRLDSSERYKGVDKVIESLPMIAMHVPKVQYIVIGNGTDLARLQKLAVKVGVSERVHFKGAVNDAALRSYYRNCDVFVLPSAGEGFGFVYLEAMQYAKPVIAADMGGSPEVVKDGVTGLLVRYDDVRQLAESLTRLCLDPALRTKLGGAGYRRLQENYTFPQFKQTLTDILTRELPAAAIYRSHSRALLESLKTV